MIDELNSPPTIYALNEQAVTIQFENRIDDRLNQKVTGFNRSILNAPFPGFRATVPAYASLTVFYDPVIVIKSDLPGDDCFAKVTTWLKNLKPGDKSRADSVNRVTIPVCYEDKFGPDLLELSQLHQISTNEVIRLHTAVIYKVYMIGFVPGFAYLGGMDKRLATPRRATPRKSVPAGAVGIAGKQTGVYPLATPGGWQIIGQTPLKLFDANREQPSLLKAGDEVRFQPITLQEFNRLAAG